MTDLNPQSPNRPSVGEEIIVPVHQAGGRTTYFPDQIVAVSTAEVVELVMLRQEFVVRAQRGIVQDVDDEQITLAFEPKGFMSELFDVGHIRIAPMPAIDMALTVLSQQIQAQRLDISAIMQRLQAMSVEAE